MALRDLWLATRRPFALVNGTGEVVHLTPDWPIEAENGGFRISGAVLGQHLFSICPHGALAELTARWPRFVAEQSMLHVLYPKGGSVEQVNWFVLLIQRESVDDPMSSKFMVMLASVLEILDDSSLLAELESSFGVSREIILIDILRNAVVNLHGDD